MDMLVRAALSGAAPLAFVTVEALLLVAAGLAAVGAALTAVLAYRAARGRAEPSEKPLRRGPSPSSVGLADDPIVAAIDAAAEAGRRPRRVRHVDQIDP